MSLISLILTTLVIHFGYCNSAKTFQKIHANGTVTNYVYTVIDDNYVKKLPHSIEWSASLPIEIIAWEQDNNLIQFQFKVRLEAGYWYKFLWRREKSGPWVTSQHFKPVYQDTTGLRLFTPIHNSNFDVLQCRIVGKRGKIPEPTIPFKNWDITSNIR